MLRDGFDHAATAIGSVLDVEQRPAADRLALLGTQLAQRSKRRWSVGAGMRRRAPSGVYLHGPVGRGKTWLVDVLLQQLPADGVLRLHAYEAARALHREFARRSGAPGATDRAVDTLLDGVRLLFLDELHAHDPGDAMLLSRLVRSLPARGAVLVATPTTRLRGCCPTRVTTHWSCRWSPPCRSTATCSKSPDRWTTVRRGMAAHDRAG